LNEKICWFDQSLSCLGLTLVLFKGKDTRTYAEARQLLASGVTELIRPAQGIETPLLVMTCENDSGSSPEMFLSEILDVLKTVEAKSA